MMWWVNLFEKERQNRGLSFYKAYLWWEKEKKGDSSKKLGRVFFSLILFIFVILKMRKKLTYLSLPK